MPRAYVLVVGAAPEITSFVTATLDPLRYGVTRAATLLEASLLLAARPQPALVVLDASLPAGDGLPGYGMSGAAQPALPVVCSAEVLSAMPRTVRVAGAALVPSQAVAHDEWHTAVEEFLAGGLTRPRAAPPPGRPQVTVDSGRKAVGSYTVEWAGDIRAAGTILARSRPPDALVLEAQLPDSRGLDFYRSIKSAYPSLPVVVLVPGGSPPVRHEILAAGVDTFLATPVDVHRLRALVKELLLGPERAPSRRRA